MISKRLSEHRTLIASILNLIYCSQSIPWPWCSIYEQSVYISISIHEIVGRLPNKWCMTLTLELNSHRTQNDNC